MNDRNRLRTLSPSPAPSPPFFTSYFDLSARVEYTWPCLAAAPRRAHAKTQFHPASLVASLLLMSTFAATLIDRLFGNFTLSPSWS